MIHEDEARLYRIWGGMKTRCYNKKDKAYPRWGGRGIIICDMWKNRFSEFKEWARTNGYNDNLTIDRINNNGNYEPSNCRWANAKTQSRNGRHNIIIKYNGEIKTLIEWAEFLGVSHTMISKRLLRGCTIKDALTRPPQKRIMKKNI